MTRHRHVRERERSCTPVIGVYDYTVLIMMNIAAGTYEYDLLDAIKAKYSGKINTDNTSAKWSDSQVRTYNQAVEKYNKAVAASL